MPKIHSPDPHVRPPRSDTSPLFVLQFRTLRHEAKRDMPRVPQLGAALTRKSTGVLLNLVQELIERQDLGSQPLDRGWSQLEESTSFFKKPKAWKTSTLLFAVSSFPGVRGRDGLSLT